MDDEIDPERRLENLFQLQAEPGPAVETWMRVVTPQRAPVLYIFHKMFSQLNLDTSAGS